MQQINPIPFYSRQGRAFLDSIVSMIIEEDVPAAGAKI
jgi:hypothetical protein